MTPPGNAATLSVFVANDTGGSPHAGCKAVMRSLYAALGDIPELAIVGRHEVGTRDIDEAAFARADVLFMNGEGTIHHDGPRSRVLLGLIDRAMRSGKRVLLVNALFQQYTHEDRQALSGLSLLTVREPLSAAFARAFGGDPQLRLDSAADPRFLGSGSARALAHGTVIGACHRHSPMPDAFDGIAGARLTMRHGPFEDIVATLQGAEVYLTGQHHGVYAAALAGCPFVAVPSNSHKIEGFVEWTGLPIPVCTRREDIDAAMDFARRNKGLYAELKAFMAQTPVLTAPTIRQALGL